MLSRMKRPSGRRPQHARLSRKCLAGNDLSETICRERSEFALASGFADGLEFPSGGVLPQHERFRGV